MSLCVAWRFANKFCLASESCITIGTEQRMCGVKVVQVPIRIIPAVDAQTQQYSTVFESVFGFTFSGHFLTAYLVRELLSEILFHLQYIGTRESLNFKTICEVVFGVYNRIVADLNADGFGYDLDLILIGACPAEHVPKAAQFFRDEADKTLKWKQVLEEFPFSYVAVGSGEVRFHEVFASRRQTVREVHFAVLHSLQEIADSREIPSVGGGVQYGEVEAGGEFRLFGTLDFVKRNARVDSVQLVQGVDLRSIYEGVGFNDLHVHYDFISPYQAKRDRFLAELLQDLK
jgi:hypothetical protein